MSTTITRANLRAALKRQGVPVGNRTYADVVHVEEFVDSWGVGSGSMPGVYTSDIIAALNAEGIPFFVANYVHVEKVVR